MTLTRIPYDRIVHTHLRRVVRDALVITARQGLPGEHHFYITFRTDHPRVQVPDYLRKQYPQEMTIVLQHKFFELRVTDDHFSVQLTFDNVPEKLSVPLESITIFNDPAANFMLRFEADFQRGDEPMRLELDPPEPDDDDPDPDDPKDRGAKVVRLDRFRKR